MLPQLQVNQVCRKQTCNVKITLIYAPQLKRMVVNESSKGKLCKEIKDKKIKYRVKQAYAGLIMSLKFEVQGLFIGNKLKSPLPHFST